MSSSRSCAQQFRSEPVETSDDADAARALWMLHCTNAQAIHWVPSEGAETKPERLILTPSAKVELPLTDDEAIGHGAFGPKIEIDARLSYDMVDRLLALNRGHHERAVDVSAFLVRADGEDAGAVYFVAGAKILF